MQEQEQIPPLSEGSLELLYSIAYRHLTGGQYHEAEKLLYSIVMFSPKNVKFWKALAFVQQKQRLYDEAWATYAVISSLQPSDPEPYLRAAECYFASDRVTDGLEALKEVEARIKHAPQLKLELTRLQQAWATHKKPRKPC